jgi:selenium-binding protein 1
MRRFCLGIFLLLLATLVVSGQAGKSMGSAAQKSAPRYLYVWAGHDARTAQDALLVVDITPGAPGYSKVVHVIPVGSTGNEPHHMGLSPDGNTIVAGGLLSGRVFFFDIKSNAARPRLAKIFESSKLGLGVADEVKPLPGRGVLVSMMGDHHAASPGGMVLFDAKMEMVSRGPTTPPDKDLNIHDFDTVPAANLLLTTDFVIPHTLIEGAPQVRETVRLWDLGNMEIRHTLRVGKGPWITKFIPGTRKALVSCFVDGTLWLVDAGASPPTARQVFDYDGEKNNSMPSIMEISSDGKRLYEALYGHDKVVELDISDPAKPRLASEVVTGKGPHFIRLSPDGKSLFVSNYFVEAGKTVLKGDNHVKRIHITAKGLALDTTFDVDLNTSGAYAGSAKAPAGAMRPHGLVVR